MALVTPPPRRVVLTGGTGPIGRAIGRRLAADGYAVTLIGRDLGRLTAVAAEVGGTVVPGDLTDPALVLPAGDVVVHSAAAYAPYRRVEHTTDPDWTDVFAVGPDAAFRLARATMPHMKARGFGRFVFVSSLAASLGGRGQAAYAAAKAALVGLARTLALEGGRHGVTANIVELGLIDTSRVREAVGAEVIAALVNGTAVGRMGTPEEVAAAVAFLCSPEASFVTGAVLPVGGGLGLGLPTG